MQFMNYELRSYQAGYDTSRDVSPRSLYGLAGADPRRKFSCSESVADEIGYAITRHDH
jgi:hypothetical protein